MMAQCLRINFSYEVNKTFLNTIQKEAKKLSLEGTIQTENNDQVLIVVCGAKETINQFVDLLHHEIAKKTAERIEIEPFIKEKDYRGVFRVIE